MSHKVIFHREGPCRRRENNVIYPIHWRCKDGYVTFYWHTAKGLARANKAMVEWFISEGIRCESLQSVDWDHFDWENLTQSQVDELVKPISELFMRYTKQELYSEGMKRRVIIFPMNNVKDIVESEQLAARNYWVEIEHPELNDKIKYPGSYFKTSECPIRIERRAPLIGEHNEEIYMGELGLSRQELINFKQCGII